MNVPKALFPGQTQAVTSLFVGATFLFLGLGGGVVGLAVTLTTFPAFLVPFLIGAGSLTVIGGVLIWFGFYRRNRAEETDFVTLEQAQGLHASLVQYSPWVVDELPRLQSMMKQVALHGSSQFSRGKNKYTGESADVRLSYDALGYSLMTREQQEKERTKDHWWDDAFSTHGGSGLLEVIIAILRGL